MKRTVFHGSLTSPLNGGKLHALSHFGTLSVALAVIGGHIYIDGQQGTPTVYEWDLPCGEWVTVKDTGAPNAQSMLLAFLDSQTNDAECIGFRTDFRKIGEGEHLGTLQRLCGKRGISLLHYENEVEGGFAYCPVLEVVPTNSYSVDMGRVISAFLDTPPAAWAVPLPDVEAARKKVADEQIRLNGSVSAPRASTTSGLR